jgi:predicted Zn-dependent protease
MKQAIAFLLVVVVGGAALYYSQLRKPTPTSSNAVVNVVADAQRDITRVPNRLMRISDEEEIRIGNELANRHITDFATLSPEGQATQIYVSQVGIKLVVHAHRKLPYEFHLVPDPNLVNAFALPGGHVFIGQGMLDLMTSEDELASVLGHELEHIDHYHCAERVQVEAKLRKLRLGVVSELVQLPIEIWQAGYSKDEELEADREGTMLAVQANYSPYGALKMFEKFARLESEYVVHASTPQQELSQLAIESISGYFRSHPLTSERIAQINALIAEHHWQDRKELKPFRIEYEVKSGT